MSTIFVVEKFVHDSMSFTGVLKSREIVAAFTDEAGARRCVAELESVSMTESIGGRVTPVELDPEETDV